MPASPLLPAICVARFAASRPSVRIAQPDTASCVVAILPGVATRCGRNELSSLYSIVVTVFFPATVAIAFVGRLALSHVYCVFPSGVTLCFRFAAASHVRDIVPPDVAIERGRKESKTSKLYVLVPDMSLRVVVPEP